MIYRLKFTTKKFTPRGKTDLLLLPSWNLCLKKLLIIFENILVLLLWKTTDIGYVSYKLIFLYLNSQILSVLNYDLEQSMIYRLKFTAKKFSPRGKTDLLLLPSWNLCFKKLLIIFENILVLVLWKTTDIGYVSYKLIFLHLNSQILSALNYDLELSMIYRLKFTAKKFSPQGKTDLLLLPSWNLCLKRFLNILENIFVLLWKTTDIGYVSSKLIFLQLNSPILSALNYNIELSMIYQLKFTAKKFSPWGKTD